jgi:hypothetical protein
MSMHSEQYGYSAQSTGYPVLGFVLLFITGCGPTNLGTVVEPSFTQQLDAVKAGHSKAIHVASWRVADDDVAQIGQATELRTLIIDQPESRITAAGLKHLAGLPNFEHLRLRGPGVDDDALAQIAQLKALRFLNVPRGSFSDAGLAHLAGHARLELLRFGSPNVSDAGIKTLREMPALTQIHLIGVPLSDASLAELAKIEQLQSLYVDDIAFSESAWQALFDARPRLHVHVNQEHHDRDPHKHEH